MTLRSIIRDNAMSNSLNSAILASLSPLVRIRLPKTRSLNELASSSYRLLTILPMHHQDRVVSMPDDRIGDASYKRSPNPSQASAPHHQVGPYLLGQEDYLLVGPPRHQVRLRHAAPSLPQSAPAVPPAPLSPLCPVAPESPPARGPPRPSRTPRGSAPSPRGPDAVPSRSSPPSPLRSGPPGPPPPSHPWPKASWLERLSASSAPLRPG